MTRALRTAIITVAGLPMLAAAQVPPKPATPPRAPAPKVAPAPRPMPAPKLDIEHEFHLLEPALADVARAAADQARVYAEDFRLQAEDFRVHAEDFRLLHESTVKIDVEAIREQAVHAAELAKASITDMKFDFDFGPRHIEPMVIEPIHIEPFKFDAWSPGQEDRFARSRPREPWAQEDPADSLYRVAREALNRGEYRRAAQVFNEVTRKFPQSRYAQDCAYWEAFSRYRIGTTDELRVALRILDGKGDLPLNVDQMRSTGRGNGTIDIPTLRTRVLGALAARGDRDAESRLKSEASQQGGQACDREEVAVRAEALTALAQMDIAAAMPTVKKVLAQRDECTVELRRRALYVVGRQPGPDAATIILDVARNDPDRGIRGEAMRWLPRVAGDAAIPQLEELLRTADDEQTQRAAVAALGAIDTDASRRAIRAIIERNDAVERLRRDAILSLAREKDGRQPSTEELNYLRALYSRMPTTGLKESVLSAVSRVPAAENEQFLLGIARNVNEPSQLRAAALQRLGRMETVKVEDIARLYDVADTRGIREQILSALAQRSEPQAIDKMMEIARRDTDPRIRSYAISLLGRSNNERAKQLLKDLIEKP